MRATLLDAHRDLGAALTGAVRIARLVPARGRCRSRASVELLPCLEVVLRAREAHPRARLIGGAVRCESRHASVVGH